MIYERLCNFSSRIPPFSRITRKSEDRELTRAVRFLLPLMTITSQGVVAASYLMDTTTLILTLLLLTFFVDNLLITIPLSAMACLVAYFIVISYPISMMNSYKLGLS